MRVTQILFATHGFKGQPRPKCHPAHIITWIAVHTHDEIKGLDADITMYKKTSTQRGKMTRKISFQTGKSGRSLAPGHTNQRPACL